jgi:carboxylesterase type B
MHSPTLEAALMKCRCGAGNPDITGLPHWPAYDLESRATMIFNDPDRDKRLAIQSLIGP